MAEINVTPMVDVMLVLLIIFMVSAPLLTVGVPHRPAADAGQDLDQDKEPLTVSVNVKGRGLSAKYRNSAGGAGCQAQGRNRGARRGWTSASSCAATARSITARS